MEQAGGHDESVETVDPAAHLSSSPPLPAWLLPVNVSPWAIAAGYLGLFALVVVPAPLALIVGLVALRDLRARPHLRGHGRTWFAIVVGLLGTLIFAFVVVQLLRGE